MNKILCSTGAFTGRSNGYNYRLLEPLSKTLACDGFELMVDDEWYPEIEEVKRYIKNLNLYIPVVHCAKDIGELREIYPDIHYVFDTKMAAFHEQMDLLYDAAHDWLWKEDHLRHYHVNDYGGGYMDWANLRTLPIGKGHVDFDRFFAVIKKTGYQGDFTVEATAHDEKGVVDADLLNEQFMKIREYLREKQ